MQNMQGSWLAYMHSLTKGEFSWTTLFFLPSPLEHWTPQRARLPPLLHWTYLEWANISHDKFCQVLPRFLPCDSVRESSSSQLLDLHWQQGISFKAWATLRAIVDLMLTRTDSNCPTNMRQLANAIQQGIWFCVCRAMPLSASAGANAINARDPENSDVNTIKKPKGIEKAKPNGAKKRSVRRLWHRFCVKLSLYTCFFSFFVLSQSSALWSWLPPLFKWKRQSRVQWICQAVGLQIAVLYCSRGTIIPYLGISVYPTHSRLIFLCAANVV